MELELDLWPLGLAEARKFMADFKYCYWSPTARSGCGYATTLLPSCPPPDGRDWCPNCGRATFWLTNWVISPDDKMG